MKQSLAPAVAVVLLSLVATRSAADGDTELPMKAPAPPAASVTAAPNAGATATLPDGRALLRAFVAASGGVKGLEGIENAIVRSTYAVPAQSMEGTITIAFAKPDKIRSTGEMGGLGKIEQGFDGTTGWAIDPMSGPRILEGLQLDQLRNSETNIFNLQSLDAQYEEVETLGRAPFAGKEAWEVRLVADGRPSTAYFDAETGLMIGMKTTVASQVGVIPAVITLSDYKTFGKLKLASRSMQSVLGGMIEATSTIDAIDFNVPADELPSFTPPPEILALKAAEVDTEE